MISIKNFINRRKLIMLAGLKDIGKETFYSNLLVDCFADKNILILRNSEKKTELLNKLNKILYGDSGRKNRFLNYNIYENVYDIQDALDLINKHKDCSLVIIDRSNNLIGDLKENLNMLRKVSIEYSLPIIIVSDVNLNVNVFKELNLADLDMDSDIKDLCDGFILLNRENYYHKRGSSDLVITRIDNIDDYSDFIKEFKFNSEYKRLYTQLNEKEKEDDEPGDFRKIAGYDDIKKELLLLKSWIDDKDEINKLKIDIPHGVIIYGGVGNGKSTIAREFARMFPNATILKIKLDNDFTSDEVTEKFEYARSLNRFTIILMDEFDIIARREERELLTELDGINGDNSNIFVIATCNSFDNINPALMRRGRLDYIIGIGNPNTNDRIELFKYYFKLYGIEGDFDFDYLALLTQGENAVNIKAIANETRLRFGTNPTESNIEEMVDKIDKRTREYYGDSEEHDKFLEAVHEVGHAVVAYQHQDFFKFYKAILEENSLAGGVCKVFATNYMPGSSERSIADIEISMGGYLACLMLYKYKDKGAIKDLERARAQSAALVNSYAYEGFEHLLNHDVRAMPTSNDKKRWNEKKSEKILARCEKNVRRIIKENKENIIKLAYMLLDKKVLTNKELEQTLGG